MAEEYTPTEAQVRQLYANSMDPAGFDRWLAEVRREAAEKGWDEGYDAHADDTGLSQMMRDMGEDNGNPYRKDTP